MENVNDMNTTTEVKCVYNGRLEVPSAALSEETASNQAWQQERFEWRSVRVFLDDGGLRFWNNLISILDIATVDIEARAGDAPRLVLIHMDHAFPTLSSPYPPFFKSALFFPQTPSGSRPAGQTTLVFRIPSTAVEEESDYGDLLRGLELLQKTVAFLGGLRPMFRRLRDHAISADEIRSEFLAFQLREGPLARPEKNGAVADKFLQTLPADRLKLLRAGFLQRDCSVLEEAIAYVPVAVYEHMRAGIPLLSHLSVDPTRYRVWRQAFLKANADNPELCECLGTPARSPRSPSRARVLAEVARASRKGDATDANGFQEKKPNLRSPTSIHMGVPIPLRFPDVLPFKLSAGGCRIAKGRTYRCEDAYFVLEREGAFGVFDGVGSWATEGIDASKFSTALAHACSTLAQEHLQPGAVSARFARLNVNLRARELLAEAHARVRRESPTAWGSSTAVVGVFDSYLGQLGVACLGDSVLTVLRRQMMPKNMHFMAGGASETTASQILSSSPTQVPRLIRKIRYRSAEQRWSNGAPYQLSNLPPENEWDSLREQGYERFVEVLQRIDNVGDSADMARGPPQPLVMHPGDLILLYSDGVADNLFDKEIEVFASLAISPEEAVAMGLGRDACTKAQDVADMICKLARRRAADRAFDKPFVPGPPGARHVPPGRGDASSAGARRGAKRDDISCVAIWVEGLPDPSFEACGASESTSETAAPPEICMTSTTVSEASLESLPAGHASDEPAAEASQAPASSAVEVPTSAGEVPTSAGEMPTSAGEMPTSEQPARPLPEVESTSKASFAEMRAGSRIPLPPVVDPGSRGTEKTSCRQAGDRGVRAVSASPSGAVPRRPGFPRASTRPVSASHIPLPIAKGRARLRGPRRSKTPGPCSVSAGQHAVRIARVKCRGRCAGDTSQAPGENPSVSGAGVNQESGAAPAEAEIAEHASLACPLAPSSCESRSGDSTPPGCGKAVRRPAGDAGEVRDAASASGDPSERASLAKSLTDAAACGGAPPRDEATENACTASLLAASRGPPRAPPKKGVSRILARIQERSTRGAHNSQLAKLTEASPVPRKRVVKSPQSVLGGHHAKKPQKRIPPVSDNYKPNASFPLPCSAPVRVDACAGRPEQGSGVRTPHHVTPPPADRPPHLGRGTRHPAGAEASDKKEGVNGSRQRGVRTPAKGTRSEQGRRVLTERGDRHQAEKNNLSGVARDGAAGEVSEESRAAVSDVSTAEEAGAGNSSFMRKRRCLDAETGQWLTSQSCRSGE
uniref:Ptc7p phosphatase (PP2C family), related n=1 Tax=Neospora caninum (strain Liverpool) TaxID=572307 RepID=A0A0F7UJY8_NEOCL|nr:TPA: Ptc7p phosphatase (PP2C family), related [Neospora caninum Liverpool]